MRARDLPKLAVAALAATLLGCSGQPAKSPADGQGATDAGGFKIGVMTGTVSQGEDEFRAAQQLAEKYGTRLKHVTYPDNFMNEQETVIAQLVGLASDPAVKVIVAGQAIPGSIAGARKIREQRPDILIGFFQPHEDPAMVNETADLAVQLDELARGRSIIAGAAAMGATSFVHYSFPRHMSQELLARRRDIMKEAAGERGMGFHFVTAPDPMAEGGLPATQQFVLEDQPRELKKLGEHTAFFSTNCGMQEPLIKSVLMNGGYLVEQCCPSPTHGYPGALGISIPSEKRGDMDYINAENRRVIAEHNMSGHFGTWPVPEAMVTIRAMANLLADAVEGKADYKDQETVKGYIEREAGAAVHISKYDPNRGNQYLFTIEQIVY